ncbi:FtsX-like permease family protein [Marinilongibacter aquaticus]|uniref:ABC transporter permease n=1 Tax=Marinilongibacter aquaticus TaxID=2975157 RepID=UPI0021BCFF94|nr:FtsX-like permease family protein [Marinilongibacter aquaticus]UBM60357.1 FtsX-like permease family protein [Marinilongibacter aquaticus]
MENLKIVFTLAWRNLWRNKMRTGIMIAATLFAVFLAILMKSVQEGAYDLQIQNLVSYHSGFLQIQNEAFEEDKSLDNGLFFDEGLAQKIQETKGISAYTPRIESFILASSKEITKGVMLTGTNPTNENQLTGLEKRVIEGKYFSSGSDALMLGKGLAKFLKVGVGDTLIFYGSGYHASTAVGQYPITAILEFGAPQLNENMIYMPLKACQELFGAPDLVTSVALNLNSRRDMRKVQTALEKSLKGTDNTVKNWEEMMPELVSSIEGDRASGSIMLGILYMIIGFVIYGTLLMMINERIREFSMLIAIGMKNKLLSATLLIECIIMTFIGAVLGSVLSLPITNWLHHSPIKLEGGAGKAYEQVGFEPVITAITRFDIVASQTYLVAIMSLLLSVYPMIKVLKINALDGMRA